MSCIWSGNVEHILHAVQLRRIIDQLTFWALRIFKPWVTECLKHWYRKGGEEGGEEGADEGTEDGTGQGEEEGAEVTMDKYELIYPSKSKNLIYENAQQLDQG